MQPGKLRHRITIEQLVTEQDPTTGKIPEDEWAPVVEREPAEVLPGRAGAFFAASQVQSTTNALVRIRHRDGLEPLTMRVRHHVTPTLDEFWSIEGVVPVQYRRREVHLMCLKRDAEGYRRGTDVDNG